MAEKAKKTERKFLRGLVVFVVCLFALVYLVGPWHSTWISSAAEIDVWQSQRDAILARHGSQHQPKRAEPILVGVGKVPIDCRSKEIPLAGYGNRVLSKGNTGVADEIFAKSLVVSNSQTRVALVTADLLLINRNLVARVLQRLQQQSPNLWTREQLYFGATHTHSGPGGFPSNSAEMLGIGVPNETLANSIADALARSILLAENQQVAATLQSAAVEVEANLIRNRTVAEDPTNRWLDVLCFRDRQSAKPLAVVTVFSAHATCRPSSDMMVSGDYPGELCRRVESETGAVCLFLAGGVGSMGPADASVPRDKLSSWLGEQLSSKTCEVITTPSGASQESPLLDITGVWIPLPPPAVKIKKQLRLSPVLAGALLPGETWIQALRIGDRIFLGTPADYSGLLAAELRDCQPGCTAIVTSFNGDYVGYILPESYYPLDKYETKLCFHGGKLGPGFQESLQQLAHQLRAE